MILPAYGKFRHTILFTDLYRPFSTRPQQAPFRTSHANVAYMRIVLQRVSSASVSVISQQEPSHTDAMPLPEPQGIGIGFLLLVAVSDIDNEDTVSWMSHKIAHLRIFEDCAGKMNRSIQEIKGSILSISQFTLYGDARKGNRPSFTAAGKPEHAAQIWDQFNEALRSQGIIVRTGTFGAHMSVQLVNDGPVTLILER